ncbi:MAG TPA: aldehyde dehydrogenase family protein [Beijerinckiaceae bacterium]|jgi:aldehyde dehydrogenase (NAD+)|nr:aldehyde dehydrogenase family protein [Microvirga sp.]HZB37078.1 aldehyde dehydrogenase family protein [Beijerinckiaceae bacterium]
MNARDERRIAAATPLYLNLVGGKRVPAADDRTIDVVCPSDGTLFAAIARSGAADVDAAVKAARAAFEGAWGRLTATERGRLLMKLADAVAARVDELGTLESQDTGKPISQGRADMVATARYFEFYGSAADKVHGETIPFLNGYTVAVVRDPHGVTGHIVPWNYPAQIFGRSVGASLACGNACVVKPAEDAGLSLIRIAELALEVGFPEGALNVVSGLGEEAGAALASHPGIDFISFTGSPEVGTLIQAAAARNHIGCTLELGGKSPQLVFADADLGEAAPVLVKAIVQNGGQTCSAGSRLLVERPAYDDVVGAVAERFAKVTAGPHDRDLDMGAMVNADQKRRVEGFAARAREAGVPMIAEGRVVADAPKGGYYVKPTLFGPVPRGNDLACEEVFGPVLSVIPFEDEADAIRLANGTPYGLVAGVWTGDARRSMRVARAMRCGQVFVNAYGAGGGIELPFGGVKKSGHGREKGFEALYEFSASKTIVVNHG